jgi:outer membrane protein TolC
MGYRPELVLARQDLKFRQFDLIISKNQLKPDLRFFANYDINGLGTRLDGGPVSGFSTDPTTLQPVPIPGNAFSQLADNEFNSWNLGLRLDIPLGYRDAHSLVRVARLNLARAYFQLKDQERKAEQFLTLQYRELQQYYDEIEAQRAGREANARQLELRFQEFRVGRGTLDVLLEAQRNFADSLANEHIAIANYNNRLAGFQFAKGTILAYNNVNISEGPLPACAQVRAVEHQRRRTLALVGRERPAMMAPGGPDAHQPITGALPSLADLQRSQTAMPTKDAPLAPPEKVAEPKQQ